MWSFCHSACFLVKCVMGTVLKLKVLHCLLWNEKAIPSLAKVATPKTNSSPFSSRFFFFFPFTASWQSITGNKTPLWFQGAGKNASLAWTHLDMDRWVSASLGPGVMEPADGWDMVTLPWVMNMKAFTVSSCHVTKKSLGLWECRAYALCQDKQRILNSWGTAAGTWLDKNKNDKHEAQHAGWGRLGCKLCHDEKGSLKQRYFRFGL